MTKCADIDVVNAAGEIYAGERSQSDVVRPGIACQRAVADGGVVISEGIIKKCFTTTGCILDAICILKERLNTGRRVARAVHIRCERSITNGCIKASVYVDLERSRTISRVANAGCVLLERFKTGGRVAVGIIALEGEGTGRRILTSVPLQC